MAYKYKFIFMSTLLNRKNYWTFINKSEQN